MVIEILNDNILRGLPLISIAFEHDLQTEYGGHNVENLSFKHIISKYKLDFKQSVAFEIIACSFILKLLTVNNITENVLHEFFNENETVIKDFIEFVKGIRIFFDWNYDNNVIQVSAYIGAAACQVQNGKTLHSTVGLMGTNKLTKEKIDSRITTMMLIIDEVSFLSEHLLQKVDKHMNVLKEVKDIMFRGCHVIFVGDFFQMLQLGGGQPLLKDNTLQFGDINEAIFLNVSHRFSDDSGI